MALDLSAAAILEKNKLVSDGPWLILLQLDLASGTVRYVRNNRNIIWPDGGNEWTALGFEIDGWDESGKGEITQLTLRLSNVDRVAGGYLEAEDGAIGTIATIRIIHFDHLDLTDAEIEAEYEIVKAKADAHWVTITLGLVNPMLQRFPKHRYLANYCRWVFKSTECGYTGSETTCDRTLSDCEDRDNTKRFGGFIGIPGEGLYLNVR